MPAETRREGQVLLAPSLAFEFETDVQHRVGFVCNLATPFALDIALQQPREGGVDYADTLK